MSLANPGLRNEYLLLFCYMIMVLCLLFIRKRGKGPSWRSLHSVGPAAQDMAPTWNN